MCILKPKREIIYSNYKEHTNSTKGILCNANSTKEKESYFCLPFSQSLKFQFLIVLSLKTTSPYEVFSLPNESPSKTDPSDKTR